MDKKIFFIFAFAGIVFFLILIFNQSKEKSQIEGEQTINSQATDPTTDKKNLLPKMTIDKEKKYTATLKTSKGDIEIELFTEKTPITVNNFISLAEKDFYNETIFHRVIDGFMIQGGDPNGDGSGGPGYVFDDEPFEGEYERGTVAMANAGPNTNGSQFFIVHQDYPLPKNYVIFGKVAKGIKVVDQIASSPVKIGISGEESTPLEPTTIESIVVEKKDLF
jgi:cyclophilin family peptidyl-prolyl cis-trans isomerase